MGILRDISNRIVVAILWSCLAWLPAAAQTPELDRLFERLQEPVLPEWETIEQQIWTEWSRSGSAAMDLLLKRGRDAMAAGDNAAAIEHLTALTDHAPDFAEGWTSRATAFYNAGQFGPSLSDIRTTLALNPRHFGALTGLAMILEELGYDEEALRAWESVHAIHPHRPEAGEAIGRLNQKIAGTTL